MDGRIEEEDLEGGRDEGFTRIGIAARARPLLSKVLTQPTETLCLVTQVNGVGF